MLHIFHMLQAFIQNVSSVFRHLLQYFIIWILHCFTHVAAVCSKCFSSLSLMLQQVVSCCKRVFQMFHLLSGVCCIQMFFYVASVLCCTARGERTGRAECWGADGRSRWGWRMVVLRSGRARGMLVLRCTSRLLSAAPAKREKGVRATGGRRDEAKADRIRAKTDGAVARASGR
jgi:hypothetical protein